MAGDSEPDDDGSRMKCCPTKGCKVYVCTKCFAVYHKSCSKKISNLKITDPDKCTVVCCGSADINAPQVNAGAGEVDMAMYREKVLECKYLQMLLDEVRDKNRVLQMNNDLLLEKLGRPGQPKDDSDNRDEGQKVSMCSRNVGQSMLVNQQVQQNTAVGGGAVKRVSVRVPLAGGPRSQVSGSEATVSGNHSEQSGLKQRQYSAIAAVNRPVGEKSTSGMSTGSNNGVYQIVNNGRNSGYKKKLGSGGTAPGDAVGFAGGDRRVWLYLYRVKRSATEEIVTQYINNKPGYEQDKITVRELPTDENQLKCFVVVAPLEKKDEMYDPSFWPNFVGIKRFDFNRHRSFLEQNGGFL